MIDRLKNVTIHARNVPRKRTQVPIRRRVSRISLVPKKRLCRVLMRRGAVLLKHKKNCLRTICACLAVASEQESCRDSMSSSL